jgi:hypothetical protein
MTGFSYGEPEPTKQCPYCGATCHADFVDIGVGMTQCGPYHCLPCGASEIGPFDKPRDLTPAERASGWYAPGAEPGSSANVIGGRIVRHDEMRDIYKTHFAGNPDWEDDEKVSEWWRKIRKP